MFSLGLFRANAFSKVVITAGFAVGLDDRDTPVGSEELCDLTYELYAYVIRAFGPGERRRLIPSALNGRGRLTMLAPQSGACSR